ncbi:MAG: glycosyltransferase family 2 protein [Deltaproteobacteria bacterium]|nr:glycosyltransferase family 2 protein [Deltaproteobacteria bacterium]
MRKMTVVMPYNNGPDFEKLFRQFILTPLTEQAIILHDQSLRLVWPQYEFLNGKTLTSGDVLNELFGRIKTKYVLLVTEKCPLYLAPETLERFIEVADSTKAAMIYSDYYLLEDYDRKNSRQSNGNFDGGNLTEHPVNDYQSGSVRDDFDFGPVILVSVSAARHAMKKYGDPAGLEYAGLYDLRLKMSIGRRFFHIREVLYGKGNLKDSPGRKGERHFDYLDRENEASQKEMEQVFTRYLKNIGAYLTPGFKKRLEPADRFPVKASVIIPVKNRKITVCDAVDSALAQKTNFPFNVIAVDNHSTDGTTEVLAALAKRHSRVKHLIPERFDLNIGGCWNEALSSDVCGRWAVQLDSDDLYSGPDTLQRIVDMFHEEEYAMVIGSYILVNEKLEEIPPGLIDHREWTDENGRNNALRINGLGAPRAYDTALLRKIGFLNVSYGEDYAMTLRILREYRMGRLFEPLYYCRRWPGNTDSLLTIREQNINNAFKDSIRSIEIMARQKMNRIEKRRMTS